MVKDLVDGEDYHTLLLVMGSCARCYIWGVSTVALDFILVFVRDTGEGGTSSKCQAACGNTRWHDYIPTLKMYLSAGTGPVRLPVPVGFLSR